jgi:hypothetical protein
MEGSHDVPRCVSLRGSKRGAAIKSTDVVTLRENTLTIHKLVNDELDHLLKANPRAKRVTISRATHEMWSEQPEACRKAVFEFLKVK